MSRMEWLADQFRWMYWTWASAAVLLVLVSCIAGLSIWTKLAPDSPRRGFLPMETTRGDRFFVGVMTLIGLHLIWMATFGTQAVVVATVASVVAFAIIFRWG